MSKRRKVWIGVAVMLVALVLLFDWDWLRHPLERVVSRKTQREFRISHLGVKLGLTPTIRMKDVHFANAAWAGGEPMAKVGRLEFSLSLRDAFEGRILIPRVALTDADLRFERLADGRKNWILSDPSDTAPSKLRISSLSVTRGKLSYVDRGLPFTLDVAVETFDPKVAAEVSSATAAPVNTAYTTRYVFEGNYREATFSGDALTGDVLSFQESGVNFPLQGRLKASTTRLEVEGTVADAAKISAIDVRLKIAGQTLANLYPFLLLPLPASPPYELQGHLTQSGARYGLDELRGKIGSTDVSGSGAYLQRSPRPLLQATLHSKLLKVADLGPLIGIETKNSAGEPPPTQSETRTRPAAKAKEQAMNRERVLPAGSFEGSRLKAIDADARLEADRVEAPDSITVEQVRVGLKLDDGLLHLDPFDVRIAGGQMASKITLDARQPLLNVSTEIDARRLQLGQLLPQSPTIAKSQGLVGGSLQLRGSGNSIADMAAKSDGRIALVMSKAYISNLVDAAAGLNGGKVLKLLVGGDKDIPLRCGAAAFDVTSGQGRSTVFVIDTEQTRIDGNGRFDLADERFDMTISPQPKEVGILSLRTPVRLFGSFRHADFELQKKDLALRAGGAIALGLIAPIAALLPLIETGPGSDADCGKLLASARKPKAGDAATKAKP